ncbi:MAG: hypothetical protein KKB37_15615, partial [Alphaproteobacteria bacterium]|nr:hypothetical protein [Alphaproteobacteria bacterium]
MNVIREEHLAISDVLAVLSAGLVLALGAILAIGSSDPAMAFHGVLFVIAGGVGAIYVLGETFGAGQPTITATGY